jgi:DNA-binding NtrC family response regulator
LTQLERLSCLKVARELKWRQTPTLARGALETLRAYDWPGNVRELENVVERAMILQRDQPLRFDALIPSGAPGTVAGSATPSSSVTEPLDVVVRSHIQAVVQGCGGRIEGPDGAARILKLNPSTLRSKMKKLGIQPAV